MDDFGWVFSSERFDGSVEVGEELGSYWEGWARGRLDDALRRAMDVQAGREEFVEICKSETGVFSGVWWKQSRVYVVTSRLGHLPVYLATSRSGRGHRVVGTHVLRVANESGRSGDLDFVSVGELALFRRMTFPFTSHRGVKELRPGRVFEFEISGSGMQLLGETTYFEPFEPDIWPCVRELRNELENACLESGKELFGNGDSVDLLMSGGTDSRAILGVTRRIGQLDSIKPVTIAESGRKNRELKVASEVARAVGVSLDIIERSRDHYFDGLDETIRIAGVEQSFTDAHLMGRYGDVCGAGKVVGGTGADVLLKGFYQKKPLEVLMFEKVRGETDDVGFEERVKNCYKKNPYIKQKVAYEISKRQQDWVEEVKEIRPRTAEEWARFYPGSRRRAINFTIGNVRSFGDYREFFLHRDIVEVARKISPWDARMRRVTAPVYNRLAGDLMGVQDANSRLPAAAPWYLKVAYKLAGRARRAIGRKKAGRSLDDWTKVEGSWIAFSVFFRRHSKWKKLVGELEEINRYIDRQIFGEGSGRGRRFGKKNRISQRQLISQVSRGVDLTGSNEIPEG